MRQQRGKMLVVDDVEINRVILAEIFGEEFDVIEAQDGEEAIEQIRLAGDDLAIVLLDIVMPRMDGFDVLRWMNQEQLMDSIPVILITGESDDEKALTGYGLGVSDLVEKPFNPEIIYRRVLNVVDLYDHKRNLERKLTEQKETLEQQARKLQRSTQFVIDALSTTVEFRNFESGEHIKRIRDLTRIILMGVQKDYTLTDEQIEAISNASAVHDIGKIAIPDMILLKPGPLNKEEFDIMKTHTLRGCEILENLGQMQDEDYYQYCYEICRHHHERWDGKGYPDGLVGDAIPIWAQATSLADVYDALTSKRIYKEAYAHQQTIEMILNGECGAFNPKLLDCLLRVQGSLQEQLKRQNPTDAGEFIQQGRQ